MDTDQTIGTGRKRPAPASQRAPKSTHPASNRRAKANRLGPELETSLVVTTDALIQSLEQLLTAEGASSGSPAAGNALKDNCACDLSASDSTVTADFETPPASANLHRSLLQTPHALHPLHRQVTASAWEQERRSFLSRRITQFVISLGIALAVLGSAGLAVDLPIRILQVLHREIPGPDTTVRRTSPAQAIAEQEIVQGSGAEQGAVESNQKDELLSAEQPADMARGVSAKQAETVKNAQESKSTEPANATKTTPEPEADKIRKPTTAGQIALEPIETVQPVRLDHAGGEPEKTVKSLGLDANGSVQPPALQEASTEPNKTAQGPSAEHLQQVGRTGEAAASQPGLETDKTVQPLSARGIALLITRGDSLLSMADVGAARLVYERAAAAGDVQAALRLGATYDPSFLLSQARLRTVRADPTRASYWYERARALGAVQPTDALTTRVQGK